MTDLMVSNESRLEGVTILDFYADQDTLTLTYEFAADRGAWFCPSDPLCDLDGWVRGLEQMTGTGSFEAHEREQFERYRRLMAEWHFNGTEPCLGADLDAQCTALWEPGTSPLRTISVKLDDDLLDAA